VRRRGWAMLAVVAGMLFVGCSSKNHSDDDDDDGGDGGGGGTAGSGGTLGGGTKGGTGGTGGGVATPTARCKSICSRLQTAGCPNFDDDACSALCTAIADMALDTQECATEWSHYFTCIEDLADPCDAVSTTTIACPDESQLASDCVASYCSDHSNETYCN